MAPRGFRALGKKKLMKSFDFRELAFSRVSVPGVAGRGVAVRAAAVLTGLSLAAHAQTVLQTVTGGASTDRMGKAVAIVGDVDNDGNADIGVGVPYSDVGGTDTGSIRILSGRTGQVLHTVHGPVAGDRLGESVAHAGDVNVDGYADFIGGAPLNDHSGLSSGLVRVWSGRD